MAIVERRLGAAFAVGRFLSATTGTSHRFVLDMRCVTRTRPGPMAHTTVSRSYTGRAESPASWDSLLDLFDKAWGADARALPAYPNVIGGVFARWTDGQGNEHKADNLDELGAAYKGHETAAITITGHIEDRPRCSLHYRPARATVAFSVDAGDVATVDAFVESVRQVFPLTARYIFVSYDTSELECARFVQDVLEARVAPGVTVFVAKRDIEPGTNPLKVMLEEQLLRAEALVAMCSRRSKSSPWIWWESSAVWARGGLVVPLFIDLDANSFGPPLTSVCQGRKLFDPDELFTAVRTVVERVSPGWPCPKLTDEEQLKLKSIQNRQDSSLEILFEPSPPFVQDDFDPSLGQLRRIGVQNLTGRTLDDVEVQLADFRPQGASFLPIRLAVMNDISQPFRLHPEETQYVDLVAYYAMHHPTHLILRYGVAKANTIPVGRYTLTVKVLARDVKARQRSFTVDVDDEGRLLLSPETPKEAPSTRKAGSGSGSRPERPTTPKQGKAGKSKKTQATKSRSRKKHTKTAQKRTTRRHPSKAR